MHSIRELNDPEIFSISIMEKVPEVRNSRTIFPPLNRKFTEIVSESFQKNRSGIFRNKEPELHKSLLKTKPVSKTNKVW